MTDHTSTTSKSVTETAPQPAPEPRPAATVMLVRDRSEGSGVEVLMMERQMGGAFGGIHVFPGGKVDLLDASTEMEAVCDNFDDSLASEILGIEKGGVSYWVACIRECFEEAGVLLARREDGSIIDTSDKSLSDELSKFRNLLREDRINLLDIAKELKLKLALDHLAYASHWITPVIEKRRFDTRFFIAKAPNQAAIHDGSELVDSLWVSPQDALRKSETGELNLIMPTIKNLEGITGFESSSSLLKEKSSNNAKNVPAILPKFVKIDGEFVGLLPSDPRYQDY